MCKVMMIAGIKPETLPKVYKLAKNMAKAMSTVEDDGVGYAAITNDGQIYGEKWLNKDEAFVIHQQAPPDPVVEKIKKMFENTIDWEKAPALQNSYTSFGQRTNEALKNTCALILHARKATSGGKVLENVHPFVSAPDFNEDGTINEPGVALIHNGSILNHDKLTKRMSTCDSEVILHEYLANSMYHNPWGVEQLAKTLIGTYTVGVLGSQLIDDAWVPYVDIFKSNKDLYGGWCPELETMVFATTSYVLETAIKESELTIVNIVKIKDGFLHRFNALTGERIEAPVSFSLSAQYMNGQHWNKAHEHSMVRPIRDVNARGPNASVFPYGPAPSSDGITATDELGAAKRSFERRHPSLFTAPYLEGSLTPEESAYFEEMKKDKETDHAALKLVSAALNIARI